MKSDRTKNGPTKKQKKWNDPFFRTSVLFRSKRSYRKDTHWRYRAYIENLKIGG